MIRRAAPALLLVVLSALPALADDGVGPPPPPAAPAAPQAPAAPSAEAKSETSDWVADFDKAVERARAEKKDLFVDFTGSDWCGWCIRLHDEVLKHDAFVSAASKEYVLVSLDFPRGEEVKAKVPNSARNAELQKKYAVQGFPTVLLMTADGDVFGQMGYAEGGPEKYVEQMKKLREAGRPGLLEAMALAKDFDAATGDAKVAAAEKALTKLESAKDGAAWPAKLVPAARAAVESDPANAKGLKVRGLKALLKCGEANDAEVAAAKALDPKNEKGLLELVVMAQMRTVHDLDGLRAAAKSVDEVVALGFQDKDTQTILLANAAFWNFQHLGDKEKAVSLAKKLKEIADPKNQRLQGLLSMILEAPKDGAKAGGMGEQDEDDEEGDEEDEGKEKHEGPEKPK